MGGRLFLERRSYRERRMMDAVRIMPVVGLVLWMVPLLWPVEPVPGEVAEGTSMSGALWYLFAVWTGLILACFALWMHTRQTAVPDKPD